VQIHLINLDASPDRLAAFTANNGHLDNVERFRAVDGRNVDIGKLTQIKLIERGVMATYTIGAIGCALSHLALWEKAITGNQPITICEDDAIFNRNFNEWSQYFLGILPEDWDFILWGWNLDAVLAYDPLPGVTSSVAYFDQGAMRRGIETFKTMRISPWIYRLHRAFGIPCYSVSPKGARRLRDFCVPLRPMAVDFPNFREDFPNNGIDIPMNGLYSDINALVCFPPLVLTPNDRATTTVQPLSPATQIGMRKPGLP
jgi:GR25 family glycosyltransferase involved in LPS biosynthesis